MAKKLTKDHRTILTGPDYTILRKKVYAIQAGRCIKCGSPRFLVEMHLHHPKGRGIGGGKRDDRIETTELLCIFCHQKEHNQRGKA